ncbi:ABC-type transport auxiliary lipoprotein family protein [Methyloceanibacter sp. wino2]|uniref:ABC-type transport auxiliary lipoprotein family protein n=1 Tax=Methyloceanibacter sp. wino2 TaxID=2170729 RepID=UPI000D3ED1AF|nr:ABC-type transport auxiliary lipoprotein family protein [Methyloceanibacter sp. wino2]
METRARYALIGFFILAVFGAAFGFVYWLENKGGFGERETYRIQFESAVPGLYIGSAVLFNGIRVGEVASVSLNPAQPQQVLATISVMKDTPIREDTVVNVEQQGLTGGVAVTLTGGTSTQPLAKSDGLATLVAPPDVGRDWTQSARDAFQEVEQILDENRVPVQEAIKNIEVFTDALARNSDKVDGILAGIERMTGGGKEASLLYSLKPATDLPPAPEAPPSWKLTIPEPTTLLAYNTDKIMTRPSPDESRALEGPRWNDSLPILVQAKLIETFENAGYTDDVTRTLGDFPNSDQLSIDIRRFDVSTGDDPTATIVILAKLQDPAGGVIGSKKFNVAEPATGNEPRDYVDALRAAFEKVALDILDWSTTTLASAPPPPPPADNAGAANMPAEDMPAEDMAPEDTPADFDGLPMPPEPDEAPQ